MAVSERTYTFRAPADLGDRMSRARATLDRLEDSTDRDELERWIADEIGLMLLRKAAEIRATEASQSSFIREAVELVVGAAEKVAYDLESADAYAEWAREDHEGARFHQGALRAATTIFRDE